MEGDGHRPPLSQIASDLRFAIRITNRNRSQIARFGALRPHLLVGRGVYSEEWRAPVIRFFFFCQNRLKTAEINTCLPSFQFRSIEMSLPKRAFWAPVRELKSHFGINALMKARVGERETPIFVVFRWL